VEKEGEGEREWPISGVRDGALGRSGNGMDWKWPIVKKDA
jgi:hypothetical protein